MSEENGNLDDSCLRFQINQVNFNFSVAQRILYFSEQENKFIEKHEKLESELKAIKHQIELIKNFFNIKETTTKDE